MKIQNRRKEIETLESLTESLEGCRLECEHKYRQGGTLWSFEPNGIYVAKTLIKAENLLY